MLRIFSVNVSLRGVPKGQRSNLSERLLRPFGSRNDTAFFIILFLIFNSNSSQAQTAPLPFKKGEVITFKIEQMKVKAGEAKLSFEGLQEINGRSLYLIIFKSDGLNFYDEEKIYLDPQSFRPVKVLRDLNIWGKKEKITEDYLPQEKKIRITKIAGEKTTTEELRMPQEVENIYGFIYRYRQSGSFKVGEQVDISLPTKQIKIKVDKKTKFKAIGKEFDAFYLNSDPSKYKIWLDASGTHIPLKISGSMGVANTVMNIIDYKEGQ